MNIIKRAGLVFILLLCACSKSNLPTLMMSVDDFEYKIVDESWRIVTDVKIAEGVFKNNRMKTYNNNDISIDVVFTKTNKIIMVNYSTPLSSFDVFSNSTDEGVKRQLWVISAMFFSKLYKIAFNVDGVITAKELSDKRFIMDNFTSFIQDKLKFSKKSRSNYKGYVFCVERTKKFMKFSVLPEQVDRLLHKEKINS